MRRYAQGIPMRISLACKGGPQPLRPSRIPIWVNTGDVCPCVLRWWLVVGLLHGCTPENSLSELQFRKLPNYVPRCFITEDLHILCKSKYLLAVPEASQQIKE